MLSTSRPVHTGYDLQVVVRSNNDLLVETNATAFISYDSDLGLYLRTCLISYKMSIYLVGNKFVTDSLIEVSAAIVGLQLIVFY